VLPYDVWPLLPADIPLTTGVSDSRGGGAAYDPSTRRIYWEHPCALEDCIPIIHVWEVLSATAVKAGPMEQNGREWTGIFAGRSGVSIHVYNTRGQLIARTKETTRAGGIEGLRGGLRPGVVMIEMKYEGRGNKTPGSLPRRIPRVLLANCGHAD
jgi:hypothetical protein